MIRRSGEHIKESIPWESMELELAAEASEGEGSDGLFMQYEPHIVLTDINIPLIDGMELARKVCREGKGYSDCAHYRLWDFEYAGRLLKPVPWISF